jgi:hypothetical protein
VIGWIAFGAALVVVLGVLGYCGYELRWRVARLQADLARLDSDATRAQSLGEQLRSAQARIAAVRAAPEDG